MFSSFVTICMFIFCAVAAFAAPVASSNFEINTVDTDLVFASEVASTAPQTSFRVTRVVGIELDLRDSVPHRERWWQQQSLVEELGIAESSDVFEGLRRMQIDTKEVSGGWLSYESSTGRLSGVPPTDLVGSTVSLPTTITRSNGIVTHHVLFIDFISSLFSERAFKEVNATADGSFKVDIRPFLNSSLPRPVEWKVSTVPARAEASVHLDQDTGALYGSISASRTYNRLSIGLHAKDQATNAWSTSYQVVHLPHANATTADTPSSSTGNVPTTPADLGPSSSAQTPSRTIGLIVEMCALLLLLSIFLVTTLRQAQKEGLGGKRIRVPE